MKFYGGAVRNTRAKIRDETVEGDVKRAVIEILATNKERDFYGTRMQDSSLANYERMAKEGVTFCDSHRWNNTGYGRTVDARRVGDDLFMDVAVLYDEKWQGLTYASGEDLIFAMRHRDFDVSIGFANERIDCSICGQELFTDKCEHFLLDTVSVNGKDTVVEGLIEDAELTETSIVYDGATPGTGTGKSNTITEEFKQRMINKTDLLIRAGKATPQHLVDLCQRLRLPVIEVPEGVQPPPEPVKEVKRCRNL